MYQRWQSQGGPHPCARLVVALAVGFGVLQGCDGRGDLSRSSAAAFESLCQSAGICDAAPAPPELIDVLCDAGLGSSCTRENARAVFDTAARFLGPRSGSRLRVWAMGANVAETHVAVELTTPALSSRTRSRRAQLERFVAHARSTLTLALEPTFTRSDLRRSPLAESLAKVALADGYGLPRRIVLVSQAREYSSVRDLACGALPSDADFARALRRRSLLAPGSLAGVQVSFAFVTSAPVGGARCAVRMSRELRIRELWRGALTRAGASEVRFDSGVPVLVGDRPAAPPSTPTPSTTRRNSL